MSEPQGSSRRKWDQSVALTGATPVTLQPVKSVTTSTLLLKKLVLSITSHGAAEVFLARDTNGSPFTVCAHTDAAAAAGVLSVVTWDFAGDGVELTLGKSLVVLTGATMTGVVSGEGWEIFTP